MRRNPETALEMAKSARENERLFLFKACISLDWIFYRCNIQWFYTKSSVTSVKDLPAEMTGDQSISRLTLGKPIQNADDVDRIADV